MRAVVQRVASASVEVEGTIVGAIAEGLLVLLGVSNDDGSADVAWMSSKIRDVRVFEDDAGKMNRSLADVSGSVLLVSQFTLLGDCRKGRRPSFDKAATPETGMALYQDVVRELGQAGVRVETGTFRARMRVALVNDGPVTLLLDSKKTF
jgi:D-tyrosyl-tRNA(Tyr) deacylase